MTTIGLTAKLVYSCSLFYLCHLFYLCYFLCMFVGQKQTALTFLLLIVASLALFKDRLPKTLPSLLDLTARILSSPNAFTPSDEVPEMADILGQDQTKRLAATRKLVERVDVDQALEILEHSPLPHTGEGHLAIHQIGFYAYQKYGLDSILKCKDYFLFGCYHGAIIEAASDQGPEAVKLMTDKCKSYGARFFQCTHAAGHAILAMLNYDLPQALKTCDQLYESDQEFPDSLSSCHNGAFMENLFGVHDWSPENPNPPERKWLSDNPYYPCTAFEEKYQKGCWLNQAARIYQMNNLDLAKTSQICQQLDNEQYRLWCMDNVARQIHPLTGGDINKAFELCQQEGKDWYDHCLLVNVRSFYSVGGRNEAIQLCNRLPQNLQPQCFQDIMSQLLPEPISLKDKQNICKSFHPSLAPQCLQQIASIQKS